MIYRISRLRSFCRELIHSHRCLSFGGTAKNYIKFSQITQPVEPVILKNFLIFPDFISEDEETCLLKEVEPKLRRMRYQYDHWDDAIHGFRETEQQKWSDDNLRILDKIRSVAFPSETSLLPHVHVLDLADKGWIKPHIDSVKFCGNTIAGVSLLSDSVMKLERDSDGATVLGLLRRRSLYIMKDVVRYEFKHSILSQENSYFGEEKIDKQRRISIICRNEPEPLEESSH